MTDGSHSKIRVRGEDFGKLETLKTHPDVKEMAVEEGHIDDPDQRVSYEVLLKLMIPENADMVSREEMRWIPIYEEEIHEMVMDLAGENVSAHEVVHRFTREFTRANEIELDNE